MPPKTPVRIAEKVLKLWLAGLPRNEISRKAGTSVGNVLNIAEEAKKNIPDIVLLRKIAVWIAKQGWKQDIFASAIRHRNILYARGLSDNQIDDLIELVDEHCYKRNISVGSFISALENISLASKKYGCTIEGLDQLISEKESLVEKWQNKEISLEIEYDDMLEKYGVTEAQLTQYKQDLPLLDTIENQRREIDELKVSKVGIQLEVANLVSESVPEEAPKGMTIMEVSKAVQRLIYDPTHFKEEIKSILDKESFLPGW